MNMVVSDRKWFVIMSLERQPVKTMEDLREFAGEITARTAVDALTEAVKRAEVSDGWKIQAIDIRLRQDA
jgi:hypothetical protein